MYSSHSNTIGRYSHETQTSTNKSRQRPSRIFSTTPLPANPASTHSMSNTDQPSEGHLSDTSDNGDIEGYSTEISDGEDYRTQHAIFKFPFPWVATKFAKEESLDQVGDQREYNSRLRRRHGHIRGKRHNHGTPRFHMLCTA